VSGSCAGGQSLLTGREIQLGSDTGVANDHDHRPEACQSM
jgi:hypothetical protein